MNAEILNPFIQGTQNVLNMVCAETPTLGKISLKTDSHKFDGVGIQIGIVGALQGGVIFAMSNDVACSIASKMMFGMPITAMDEMSLSAISELSNMISGNIATVFSGNGKLVDITPPTCKLSPNASDFAFVKPGTQLICLPLHFSDGKIFEVNINIKE